MKKILYATLIALSTFSCKKEEVKPNVNQPVPTVETFTEPYANGGTWNIKHYKYYEVYDGTTTVYEDLQNAGTFTFNEDGTLNILLNGTQLYGSYEISSDRKEITIGIFNSPQTYPLTWTTNNKMSFTITFYNDNDYFELTR